MNPLLLQTEVQAYLLTQVSRRPEQLALEKSPFEGISSSELATQLDGRKRSRFKLPSWYRTAGVYFPKRLNLEQCSSEVSAEYKAALLSEGSRVLDMTGGFGVDSFAFAQRASQVSYAERDGELTEIVRHNAKQFGIKTLKLFHADGLRLLSDSQSGEFDLIYLDPARRKNSQKTFKLADCEPNVVALLPELLAKAPQILLKLSPMLDIQEAIRQLKHLKEMHILSVDGECKEFLCLLQVSFTQEPEVIIAAHRGQSWETVRFELGAEINSRSRMGPPKKFLYEPGAAWLKSGAFKYIGQHYNLEKLHPHTHLYTSDQMVSDFIGKVTEIQEVLTYSDFKKQKQPHSATVVVRNFPLRPEELRRRHKIGEDRNQHLYFCRGNQEELLVIRSQSTDPTRHHELHGIRR